MASLAVTARDLAFLLAPPAGAKCTQPFLLLLCLTNEQAHSSSWNSELELQRS